MARKKCNGAGPAEKIKNKKQQSKNKWENVKKKCNFNESLCAFKEVGWESGSRCQQALRDWWESWEGITAFTADRED